MELQLDLTKIYAIALEGGGARGSYQVGAWRALQEAGIRYNAVSGTSVGALNGAMMAMGDLTGAEKLWRDIRFSLFFATTLETIIFPSRVSTLMCSGLIAHTPRSLLVRIP